jgi:hypothetical protein
MVYYSIYMKKLFITGLLAGSFCGLWPIQSTWFSKKQDRRRIGWCKYNFGGYWKGINLRPSGIFEIRNIPGGELYFKGKLFGI